MSEKNSASPTRVVLVEDHGSFRQALALMLDLEQDFAVVAQAGSLSEARSVTDGADLVVVDLALPDGSGVDLIEELRLANPGLTVLVLSATLDDTSVARAIDSGAAGVVDKLAGLEDIIHEARRLRAGSAMPRQEEVVQLLRTVADPGRQHPDSESNAGLTDRETEVLRALASGLDGEGVAEKLGMSLGDERDHVANILGKLGAHSRLQALAIAARRGLIALP